MPNYGLGHVNLHRQIAETSKRRQVWKNILGMIWLLIALACAGLWAYGVWS